MWPCMERTLLEKVLDLGHFDFITAGAEDGKLEEMLGQESLSGRKKGFALRMADKGNFISVRPLNSARLWTRRVACIVSLNPCSCR